MTTMTIYDHLWPMSAGLPTSWTSQHSARRVLQNTPYRTCTISHFEYQVQENHWAPPDLRWNVELFPVHQAHFSGVQCQFSGSTYRRIRHGTRANWCAFQGECWTWQRSSRHRVPRPGVRPNLTVGIQRETQNLKGKCKQMSIWIIFKSINQIISSYFFYFTLWTCKLIIGSPNVQQENYLKNDGETPTSCKSSIGYIAKLVQCTQCTAKKVESFIGKATLPWDHASPAAFRTCLSVTQVGAAAAVAAGGQSWGKMCLGRWFLVKWVSFFQGLSAVSKV